MKQKRIDYKWGEKEGKKYVFLHVKVIITFSKSNSSNKMLAFLFASAACLSLACTIDSIQR